MSTFSTVATRSCKAGYFIEKDDKGRCSSAFLKNLTRKRGGSPPLGGALSPRGSPPLGGALSPRGSPPLGGALSPRGSPPLGGALSPRGSPFHFLCCWFTLRNLALGKFSFFLRNLLFFTKFKSVNFF